MPHSNRNLFILHYWYENDIWTIQSKMKTVGFCNLIISNLKTKMVKTSNKKRDESDYLRFIYTHGIVGKNIHLNLV